MEMAETSRSEIPPEVMKEAARLVKKQPRLFRRIKYGALLGLVAAALAMGYRQNAIDAYLSSKTANQDLAKVLREERDTRSAVEKFFGRGKPPVEIPVGKRWKTQRDEYGRITEIGKDRVLSKSPSYFQTTPRIPTNVSGSVKTGLMGIGAGAGLGAASFLRKRRKIRKQQEHLQKTGQIKQPLRKRIIKRVFQRKPK